MSARTFSEIGAQLSRDTDLNRHLSAKDDSDADYEAFESWRDDANDETFAEWARDFLDSPKAGTTLRTDGWDTFDAWLYERSWPAARSKQ